MKKNILIIFSFFCLFIAIDVNAYTNGAVGTIAGGRSCDGGNCYTSAQGMRLTIVNKNGDRCWYDKKNANVICNPSSITELKEGERYIKSKSIDYWFDVTDIYEKFGTDDCLSYSEKRTKKEFIGNMNNYEDKKCTTNYKDLWDLSDLKFPSNFTNDWVGASGIEKTRVAKNIDKIVNYIECTLKTSTYKPKKFGTDEELNCENVKRTDDVINAIFSNSFGVADFKISKVQLGKMGTADAAYIQFEQVASMTNMSGTDSNGTKYDSHTYMGSVAEVAYMYNNANTRKWAVIQNCWGYSGVAAGVNVYTYTSALASEIWNGWNATSTLATGMSKVADFSDFSNYTKSSSYGKFICASSEFNLGYWYLDNTRNVFAMWINSDIGVGRCDPNFADIITNHKKEITDKTGEVIDETKFKTFLNSNKDDYKAFIDTCTVKDSDGNVTSFQKTITDKDGNVTKPCPSIYDLDKLTVSMKIDTSYSSYTCNKDLTCSGSISSIKSTFSEHISNLKSSPDNYGSLTNTIYDKFINLFSGTDDKLLASNWIVTDDGPSCNSMPYCPGEITTGNCSTPIFTISDKHSDYTNKVKGKVNESKSYLDACLKQNYAYNIKNGNKVQKTNTSEILSLSSICDNCKVYCAESVKFDLSGYKDFVKQNEVNVEAGRILKWGKDDKKRVFGTMTIDMDCYVVPDAGKTIGKDAGLNKIPGSNHIFDSDKGVVNTVINIKYVPPTSMLKGSDKDTKTYEYELPAILIRSHIGNVFSPIGTAEMDGESYAYYGEDYGKCATNYPYSPCLKEDGSYLRYFYPKFPGDAKTITRFQPQAVYSFVYGNDLTWYSDKTSNFKNTNSVTDTSNPAYIFIGYGFPTSFTSPKVTVTNGLTVKISNVGTVRNGKNHFEDLLFGTVLSYSCEYKVNNQIFCYEGDCEPKKDCDPSTEDCGPNTPKGLDVVFRTVDLISKEGDMERAFPGRTGNGTREKGKNWSKLDDTKIVKILKSDVYNNEPMYHINLTPDKIRYIRESNLEMKNAGNDPYSYMGDSSYVFKKLGYVDALTATTRLKFCTLKYNKDTSEYSECEKWAEDTLHTATLANANVYKEFEYIFAASKFLTDLSDLNYLDGNCFKSYYEFKTSSVSNKTEDRAKFFSDLLGCQR